MAWHVDGSGCGVEGAEDIPKGIVGLWGSRLPGDREAGSSSDLNRNGALRGTLLGSAGGASGVAMCRRWLELGVQRQQTGRGTRP